MDQDPVLFNIEVAVSVEDDVATVHCPVELRITERVASILHQAMQARGLKLKKWTLTEEQQKELAGLSNVILGESE